MNGPSAGPLLQVRGASVGHRGRAVLTGLDLDVAPGEVVAVRGANGTGKSTLVRTVVGLGGLLDGRVQLFGTDLARFRDWRRIGYMPQRHAVAAGIPVTVRELVATGRLNRLRPWQRFRDADRCAVDCALESTGLAGDGHRQLAELSGGQHRRALVARALAGDPELLVLDEPTAGVDTSAQHVLARTLAGLAATGTGVVVVLHEVGPLAPVLTRTLTLGQDAETVVPAAAA